MPDESADGWTEDVTSAWFLPSIKDVCKNVVIFNPSACPLLSASGWPPSPCGRLHLHTSLPVCKCRRPHVYLSDICYWLSSWFTSNWCMGFTRRSHRQQSDVLATWAVHWVPPQPSLIVRVIRNTATARERSKLCDRPTELWTSACSQPLVHICPHLSQSRLHPPSLWKSFMDDPFWISQGTMATAYRWGGRSISCLCKNYLQISFTVNS